MQKTIGVLIGRFQPLHSGHVGIIKQAMKQCDQLLILVGSANLGYSPRNPWSFIQRKQMLNTALDLPNPAVKIYPINDYFLNDNQWRYEVRNVISIHCEQHQFESPNIKLFGHMKEGNFYLKMFPEFESVFLESETKIDGTTLRQWYHQTDPTYPAKLDCDYYESETDTFANYPYPETLNFNCSDVVLEYMNKILLIQRSKAPGIGLWALPGGFKNGNESFVDAGIRELIEETGIKIRPDILRQCIVSTNMIDKPGRTPGIARNTMCIHIILNTLDAPELELDITVDPDQAVSNAKWVNIYDALDNYKMFHHHESIIMETTKCYPMIAMYNPSITFENTTGEN